MIHDFYMGENKYPLPDEFDHNVDSKTMVERISEQLAGEQPGDTLLIVVITKEEGP